MNKPNTNLCSLLNLYKTSDYHQNKNVDEKHRALHDYIEANLFNRLHVSDMHIFLKNWAKYNQLLVLVHKKKAMDVLSFPLINTDFVYKTFKDKYKNVIELINCVSNANFEEFKRDDFYMPREDVEYYLDNIYVIT